MGDMNRNERTKNTQRLDDAPELPKRSPCGTFGKEKYYDKYAYDHKIHGGQGQDIPDSLYMVDSKPRRSSADSIKSTDMLALKSFYQRLFPWRAIFQWLNHSPTPREDFAHREFAFTLSNDAYLRYQSFPTADLLRQNVLLMMPTRFEIGPIYSTNPRDRKLLTNTTAFKPISKELCFDLDLTDYDDIRTCCDKATICVRCWRFVSLALRVLDTALRDDFGFKHILWIYSGRRGAHAWVCDRRARELDDRGRRSIASYLEVIRGGAQGGKKISIRRPLHPHIERSLSLLKDRFQEDVLCGQDPWKTTQNSEQLLTLLPDKTLNDTLRKKWEDDLNRPSKAKWADIDDVARSGVSKMLDTRALLEAKQDIVLEYTYPRLDIEVSKKLNHLLKSPFVVHPSTGRVCVPIIVGDCGLGADDFNPLQVPTLHKLLEEINTWMPTSDSQETEKFGQVTEDWEKTSLRPYIEYFKSFIRNLIIDEKGLEFQQDSLDF